MQKVQIIFKQTSELHTTLWIQKPIKILDGL